MREIEPELRCPAPRPTRLRAGARLRFALNLGLFLLLGGLPLIQVTRQILVFQTLQRDGQPTAGTVLRRHARVYPAGVRIYTLDCLYASASGKAETARVAVSRRWWLASRPTVRLQFRDPYGVERGRTQVLDKGTWARVSEGGSMTVLVCARRRGWCAASPLLRAEAAPLPPAPLVPRKSERQ